MLNTSAAQTLILYGETNPETNPMSLTERRSDISIKPISELLTWTQFANCKGKMRLYFAPRAERPQARTRREAKALFLCAECTVKDICRNYARNNHEYGYWGGENEEERHLAGFTIAAPIGIRAREARLA